MEVRRVSIREAKKRIKNDPELSKMLLRSSWKEICAFMNGRWLRIAAELSDESTHDLKVKMLEKYPELKAMYSAEDDNTQVLCIKNATATFSSFTAEPEVIQF